MRYDRNSHPRFIGDGMSKLTGSVAPIDHGLTVTLRVTRKSIMLISKSTTTSNQPPSCLRRGLLTASRRLAAVLAADVAGYSRLMGADEEGTLERLKALRRELLDPKIVGHHG